VNPILSAILRDQTVESGNGKRLPLRYQISAKQGLFLQESIRANRPSTSIEIGCAYGISSLFICEALREVGAKSHTIIDPYQMTLVTEESSDGYEGIGLLNLEKAGFRDMIDFHAEPSFRCLPRLEASNRHFDFAFVDGMHTFDYVFADFFYLDKMLPVGGVIVFDDLHYRSIRKVCRYILANLPYEAIGPDNNRLPTFQCKAVLSEAARLPVLDRFIWSDGQYLAMRKTGNDLIGDSTSSTRHWTDYSDF
jgi:predicted O-methyltransferase YrrM